MANTIISNSREMDDNEGRAIATELGLTYSEYSQLVCTLESIEDDDDFTIGYILKIKNASYYPEIIRKIEGLKNGDTVILGALTFADFNDYDEQLDAMLTNADIYDSFNRHQEAIKELNKISGGRFDQVLKRQLYVSLIGNLEVFLSTTFIRKINDEQEYFIKFIETYPGFKERKFNLKEIFHVQQNLKNTVEIEALEVIYHNLSKVRNMYVSTFEISFPKIEGLSKAVNVRHDLVHRNGKTKTGDSITISSEIILNLIEEIKTFVEDIAKQLKLDYFQ